MTDLAVRSRGGAVSRTGPGFELSLMDVKVREEAAEAKRAVGGCRKPNRETRGGIWEERGGAREGRGGREEGRRRGYLA